MSGERPARPAHRLPRGAARRRAAGLARRGPRRRRRAHRPRLGPTARGPRGVRRHAGEAQSQRPTFDALFDLYFPRLVGGGGPRSTGTPTRAGPVRDNAAALEAFRDALAEALERRRRAGGCATSPPRGSAGSARCPGAGPGCRRGRRTPRCSGWRRPSWSTGSWPALLAGGPHRRGGAARRRAPGRRRSPRWSRATPAAGSPRRRAPTTSPTSPCGRASTGSTSPGRPQRRPRGDAPRDLPARPAPRHPADQGAPRPAPRPARLPAHRARVDVDRRRPADHPPPAQAAAPHRAGRALRRERVGGELRAVHAAAGLRAARPVPEGAGLHVHRPRARGHPPLQARRRRRRRDGRPGRQHLARRAVGAHQLRPRVHEVRRASTPTRSARRRRC